MNWAQVEGKWPLMLGHIKATWSKLTDDDLRSVAGSREGLVSKVQERYGVQKRDAAILVNDWFMRLAASSDGSPAPRVPTPENEAVLKQL